MYALRGAVGHPTRRFVLASVMAMLVVSVPAAGANASPTHPVASRPLISAVLRPAAVRTLRPQATAATAVMQVAYSLTRDSDGQVPAAGDSVTLLFAGRGAAWFLATSKGGDLSVQGMWSYSSGKISLSFATNGFTRKGTFRADLGASSIVIPFQVFSTKPGTSTWAATAADPVAGAQTAVLAAAEASPAGLTSDQIVTTAAQYISSITGAAITAGPGFSSIASGSATSSSQALLPATPRLKSVDTFRSRYSLPAEAPGHTAQVEAMARSAASLARRPDGFWNLDGIGVSDVTELGDGVVEQLTNAKTVTVVLVPNTVGGTGVSLQPGPFASDPRTNLVPEAPGISTDDPPVKKAFYFEPFNALTIRSWTSADGTLLSSTVYGFSQDEHFDEEQALLENDHYRVLRATGGAATAAKLVQDLAGSTPGLIVIETHGGSDGTLLTGDDFGSNFDRALTAMLALAKSLHAKYGMPEADFSLGGAPIESSSTPTPLKATYFGAVDPNFWTWLRTEGGADFRHSIVYVGACQTDQSPALRNAIEARAYFAYSPTVSTALAGAAEFYLISEITRPTVTAEEAYYNMLRVDTTGQEAYTFDSIFDGVFKGQQNFNPKGVSAGIYQVLNAYGWNGSTMAPYVGNGWLTKGLDEGEIWTMLWASRWDRNTKQGVANLKNCYEALWSKFQLGSITSTCQKWTDGNVPTKNEYDYVIYLLTGQDLGFSHTLVPRFTLNDGH